MSAPSVLFHVTTVESVDSIREHGLDNTRCTHDLWSNVEDWDDGAYLWDSHERADAYADDLRRFGFEPVILRVDADGLELAPDLTGDQPVAGAYFVRQVPATRLTELDARYAIR